MPGKESTPGERGSQGRAGAVFSEWYATEEPTGVRTCPGERKSDRAANGGDSHAEQQNRRVVSCEHACAICAPTTGVHVHTATWGGELLQPGDPIAFAGDTSSQVCRRGRVHEAARLRASGAWLRHNRAWLRRTFQASSWDIPTLVESRQMSAGARAIGGDDDATLQGRLRRGAAARGGGK